MLWRLLLLALLLGGCQATWVRTYRLDFEALNDNNALLTLEGTSNLPPQAPLEASLLAPSGQRLVRGQATVSGTGTFAAVLDIAGVPGRVPLILEVRYDPQRAPVHVLAKTGVKGEGMAGPQVEFVAGRRVLVKRVTLTLAMDDRQAALRETERGEEGIRELEAYLARHPEDGQALLMLAVACLKARPEERHPGSKAHALLERGLRQPGASQEVILEARLWASRLESEEKARRAERERQKKKDPAERLRGNRVIVPGQSLGEIRLGLPLRLLGRRYALDHQSFATQDPVERFVLKGGFLVEADVDRSSGQVVGLTTRSDFFRVEGGLGVGSLLQEAEEKYGTLPLSFGPEEKRPDGCLYATAEVTLNNGLVLTVERRTNPTFPVPVDTIVAVGVVAAEAPEATPEAQLGPLEEDSPEASSTP